MDRTAEAAVSETRSTWTLLSDRQLLAQCRLDTYRASGPGGQKRNKTSSAVRLRHLPSGLVVIAEESRSQHENKARALRRLRKRLYLRLREPFPAVDRVDETLLSRPSGDGETRMSRLPGAKDERFWPAVGRALDALEAHEGSVRDAANALGVSTSQFVDFLAVDAKVWEEANAIRKRFGQKLLRQ